MMLGVNNGYNQLLSRKMRLQLTCTESSMHRTATTELTDLLLSYLPTGNQSRSRACVAHEAFSLKMTWHPSYFLLFDVLFVFVWMSGWGECEVTACAGETEAAKAESELSVGDICTSWNCSRCSVVISVDCSSYCRSGGALLIGNEVGVVLHMKVGLG